MSNTTEQNDEQLFKLLKQMRKIIHAAREADFRGDYTYSVEDLEEMLVGYLSLGIKRRSTTLREQIEGLLESQKKEFSQDEWIGYRYAVRDILSLLPHEEGNESN